MAEAGQAGAQRRGWFPGASTISRVASWSVNIASAAAGSVSSYLGYEDLEVVESQPEGAQDTRQTWATGHEEDRKAWWGRLKDYMGKDIMSLMSLLGERWPHLQEPFTVLQKMSEIMEYSDLLDKAAACEDPERRLLLVAALAVGAYPSNERTYKPFNPLLGETFEFKRGTARYIAEQVSHHPPVAAGHARGPGWVYEITSAPRTKFFGNYIDVFPVGRTRISLRGETYAIYPPQSRVNNVLMGRTWIDHFGELTVVNLTNNMVCDLVFEQCGWFGANRYTVTGTLFGADDAPLYALEGKWNGGLGCCRCDAEGNVPGGAAWEPLWEASALPAEDPFGFTHLAHELNGFGLAPANMLASDSRLRPDRRALEAGELAKAGAAKHELEERQRAERRLREERGDGWAPRWFRVAEGADNNEEVDTEVFEFTGAYDERAGAAKAHAGELAEVEFSPWQYPDSEEAVA